MADAGSITSPGRDRRRSRPRGAALRTARATDRRRPTVLVVDDDAVFRKLVQKSLELEGYATRSAFDAADALRSFVQVRPDLIVLDISLPGMDGFDVLERVRDLDDV